ncbi:MAG: hypothetical protein HC854_08860 [Flavobacterium sp.]|nr:hypothetical protein [Flavobacterium sp.]
METINPNQLEAFIHIIIFISIFLSIILFFFNQRHKNKIKYYLIKFTEKNDIYVKEIKALDYIESQYLDNASFWGNAYRTYYKINTIDNKEVLIDKNNIFKIIPMYEKE